MTYTEALKKIMREADIGMQNKVNACSSEEERDKMFAQVQDFMFAKIKVSDLIASLKGE